MMTFNEMPEFSKELNRLIKKYESLHDDLQEFKNVLKILPLGNNKHFATIIKEAKYTLIKSRLFCRFLKGSSLRIIYAYSQEKNTCDLISIYCQNDESKIERNWVKEYKKIIKKDSAYILQKENDNTQLAVNN